MQRHLFAAPLLIAAAVACSDTTRPGATTPQMLSVSFSGTAPASAADRTSTGTFHPSASITVSDASSSLVIDRVQLVADRLELKQVPTATCPDEDADDDAPAASSGSAQPSEDCDELETGPQLVDLPVTGGAAATVNVPVPAGTYRALEVHVRPVHGNGESARAFLAAHPDFAGVSIRVDGTFNGTPFTFTTPLDAKAEIEFPQPVVVDQSGLNVTVNIDLSTWFMTSAGMVIDPSTAGAGGANEAVVANNIRASFRAFADNDHDGQDDHGDRGDDGNMGNGQNGNNGNNGNGGHDDGAGHH